MFEFRTIVRSGHEAQRVSTAFYRFLELQPVAVADAASMRSQVLGEFEQRVFEFWSPDAASEFERFVRDFRVEPPAGLPRPFGLE